MGKLGLLGLRQDRVYLLNPGQTLALPDRELECRHPPVFDAPETTAVFDRKTRDYFSADAFGALMTEAVEDAAQIPPKALRDGITTWATVDSPWLPWVDPRGFQDRLQAIRALSPARVLSSHLPPAAGMERILFESLDAARSAAPFVGPDQAALEAMMAA